MRRGILRWLVLVWSFSWLPAAASGSFDESKLPQPTAEDKAFALSLFEPTAEERAQARAEAEAFRDQHAAARAVWARCFEEPTEKAILAALWREFHEAPEEDWPRSYRGSVRMSVDGHDPFFVAAANFAPGDRAVDFVPRVRFEADTGLASVTGLPPAGGEAWYGVLLHALAVRNFPTARGLAARGDPSWKNGGDALAAIDRLAAAPDVAEHWFVVLDAIRGHYEREYGPALLSLTWEAYELAETDVERGRALARAAAFHARDFEHRNPGSVVSDRMRATAARLIAGGGDDDLHADCAAAAADAELGLERPGRAAEIYSLVSLRLPETRDWGRSTYNSAWLLRRMDMAREAIARAETIFLSTVNDEEAGGDIMETNRNYRHKAALLISSAYEDLRQYRRALEWLRKAQDTYKLRSWCGTCARSSREHMKRELARLEALAGE